MTTGIDNELPDGDATVFWAALDSDRRRQAERFAGLSDEKRKACEDELRNHDNT